MRATVMGAGLLGCATALELARRGVDVTLVDREPAPMRKASLVNEGKIHLGYVYGHDHTRATADTMLAGAVTFAPVLRDLLGDRFDAVEVSRPFTYLVAADSMVDPAVLLEHYAYVQDRLEARLRDDEHLDYLGTRAPRALRPLAAGDLDQLVPSGRAALAVETPERSVSTWDLAPVVAAAVAASDRVTLVLDADVTAVERTASGFEVCATRGGDALRLAADHVVNCLWAGRLAVDATIDVQPPQPWAYRLKYRVLFEVPASLAGHPSLTIALGPYGDVVLHEQGHVGYASWYPECLQGWSDELAPPASWATAGTPASTVTDEPVLGVRALAALDEWCPGLAGARVLDVAAGVIMAWGQTDIVDHASRLHRRDELGVWSYDGYHTVETGKFTTAPMMALRAADAVAPVVARHSHAT